MPGMYTISIIPQNISDGAVGPYDIAWDLKGPNYGIHTFYFYAALSLFERNLTERIIAVCYEMELKAFKCDAAQINPNTKSKGLRFPLRVSEHEIRYQREFKLLA